MVFLFILSGNLSSCEKLTLCQGLNFTLPDKINIVLISLSFDVAAVRLISSNTQVKVGDLGVSGSIWGDTSALTQSKAETRTNRL